MAHLFPNHHKTGEGPVEDWTPDTRISLPSRDNPATVSFGGTNKKRFFAGVKQRRYALPGDYRFHRENLHER